MFALAPGPGSALRPESLAVINVPVRLMTGEMDDVTPITTNARLMADTIPGAQFEPVAGVGHYIFLDPCTPKGKRHVPICKDSMGIEREEVHDCCQQGDCLLREEPRLRGGIAAVSVRT